MTGRASFLALDVSSSESIRAAVRGFGALVDRALDTNAPDWVLGMIRRLPDNREFTNLNEVWTTLGGSSETQRF